MLLKDLTKVWVSEYETVNNHGEKSKVWKYKNFAFLNLQQDLNELDRNSTGEVDYSIENARTDMDYGIPDYLVTDCPKVGKTTLYKLEKYNGD